MMNAYHYSTKVIATGEIIRSDQHNQTSFNLVWGHYKKVADELGIIFPREYGYAYAEQRSHFEIKGDDAFWKVFEVTAPEEAVIRANLDYSVYKSMAELGALVDRSIKSLEERLAKRDAALRERAKRYFTELSNPESIELISDRWTVK